MCSAVAADDVILRADGFCRPEESVCLLEDGNPKKKQILRGADDENALKSYLDDPFSQSYGISNHSDQLLSELFSHGR